MTHHPAFICLCAVYNHRAEWQNALYDLFLQQDYPGLKILVFGDDRSEGNRYADRYEWKDLEQGSACYTRPATARFPGLMEKYDWMISEFDVDGMFDDAYVCVMDDDDYYHSDHLSLHAEVLKDHAWSYPETVYSTYHGPVGTEDTGGRFWASSAYRMSALRDIGWYGNDRTMGFDQKFIGRMREKHGEPGKQRVPSYCYNWGITGDSHTSAHSTGFSDTQWYGKTVESKKPEGVDFPSPVAHLEFLRIASEINELRSK